MYTIAKTPSDDGPIDINQCSCVVERVTRLGGSTVVSSTLGGVIVVTGFDDAVSSSTIQSIFWIACNAALRSVPCCRNGTVRGGCDSTSCKSCKINVNQSIDHTLGSVQ
jgi:hypothetical protein